MYGFLLFLHLAGLAVWLGTTAMSAFLLMKAKQKLESKDVADMSVGVVRTFNALTHTSAFLVLLSGILLLLRLGMENHSNFPFWLLFMEQFGSIVILLFIILLSILSGKARKALQSGDAAKARKSVNNFIAACFVMAVLVLVIIFVVSGKY